MDNNLEYKNDSDKIKFECKKCTKCCKNSKIRISPFDILRICRTLNLSTSDFLRKYAYLIHDKENKNLLTCMLKTSPKCPFLDDNGCTVYNNRPSACRIYPLAITPFYNGKDFKKNFYILEKCRSFDTKNEITLKEFKKAQDIDGSEIYDPWVIFKVKAINANNPATEEFYLKFFKICYDFDSPFFKQILAINNIQWPENIEERYKLIILIATRFLLD